MYSFPVQGGLFFLPLREFNPCSSPQNQRPPHLAYSGAGSCPIQKRPRTVCLPLGFLNHKFFFSPLDPKGRLVPTFPVTKSPHFPLSLFPPFQFICLRTRQPPRYLPQISPSPDRPRAGIDRIYAPETFPRVPVVSKSFSPLYNLKNFPRPAPPAFPQ